MNTANTNSEQRFVCSRDGIFVNPDVDNLNEYREYWEKEINQVGAIDTVDDTAVIKSAMKAIKDYQEVFHDAEDDEILSQVYSSLEKMYPGTQTKEQDEETRQAGL